MSGEIVKSSVNLENLDVENKRINALPNLFVYNEDGETIAVLPPELIIFSVDVEDSE